MAETDLNLSLDDIIKRNAENSKKRVSTGGGSRRGGRGGRGSRSSSDFLPKGLGVQSRVVKTIRGGRGQGRGGRDRAASRVRRCRPEHCFFACLFLTRSTQISLLAAG